MLSYPAGDQIPGEPNLLLIMLTNHQSITLHLCNVSNPIKASCDYFRLSCTHILVQSSKPQASKGKKSPVAPPRTKGDHFLAGTSQASWVTSARLQMVLASPEILRQGCVSPPCRATGPPGFLDTRAFAAKANTEPAHELRFPKGEKGCHAPTGGLGLEREGADSASPRMSGCRFVQEHRTLPCVPHILCHAACYRREERLP